jgi:actin related protein 2/3 complex subunit 5
MADANVSGAVQEAERMIQQNNPVGALKAALSNPPSNSKDQNLKDRMTAAVLKAMALIRDSDIENTVNSLGPEYVDALMKYIYSGFEAADNSPSMLKWHQVVSEKGGPGCIVRAICDKKIV